MNAQPFTTFEVLEANVNLAANGVPVLALVGHTQGIDVSSERRRDMQQCTRLLQDAMMNGARVTVEKAATEWRVVVNYADVGDRPGPVITIAVPPECVQFRRWPLATPHNRPGSP